MIDFEIIWLKMEDNEDRNDDFEEENNDDNELNHEDIEY